MRQNYRGDKRRKEELRKQKKEAKRLKLLNRKDGGSSETPNPLKHRIPSRFPK